MAARVKGVVTTILLPATETICQIPLYPPGVTPVTLRYAPGTTSAGGAPEKTKVIWAVRFDHEADVRLPLFVVAPL
jgi:hypothetical protein